LALIAFVATASSCKSRFAGDVASESDVYGFFENSKRRAATESEARYVARVDGCTAYFVENRAGKTILGSARHCFKYNIQSWCENGGRVRDNFGNSGECTRIIAADAKLDIAFFEASLQPPAPGDTLRLASYTPKLETQLRMIGYPADRMNVAKLNVTESCWVIRASTRSPHGDSRLGDLSSMHNCSTYGGNSGGPMIPVGTRDVIGLPFTYRPGDYTLRKSTSANPSGGLYLAQMAGFLKIHRAKLEAEGVVIVDSPGVAVDNGPVTTTSAPSVVVALGETTAGGTELFLAGATEAVGASVCIGNKAECAEGGEVIGVVTVHVGPGAAKYRTAQPIKIVSGMVLTIRYQAKGSQTPVLRSIRLKSR